MLVQDVMCKLACVAMLSSGLLCATSANANPTLFDLNPGAGSSNPQRFLVTEGGASIFFNARLSATETALVRGQADATMNVVAKFPGASANAQAIPIGEDGKGRLYFQGADGAL